MKATAIIADDEPLLRAQLRDSLRTLWPDLAIIAEADHGEDALQSITEHQPDFAFLDIEMPGLSGLDVAAKTYTLAKKPFVVFVTAYDQYAIDAFERGAIDYVLKPASKARLTKTITRLQRLPDRQQPQLDEVLQALAMRMAPQPTSPYLTWIHASLGTQINMIAVEDVMLFQSDMKYTKVITATGEFLIRLSLTELLEKLDPNQFRQVHRGAIVNVSAIHAITKDELGGLSLTLKHARHALKVTRSFAHQFKTM
jgi:DNA-binding LytR/AlgR family response regulator